MGTPSNLPHGNRVERRYGSKILIQPFLDRDEVNFYQSGVRFSPVIYVSGTAAPGHWFDQPPGKVVLTFMHEFADPCMWRFPPPLDTNWTAPSQSATLQIVVDDQEINPARGWQIAMKKDLPSDNLFYEAIVTELAFSDFALFANGEEVEIRIEQARFIIDLTSRLALKGFLDIMREGVDANALR